MNDTAGLSVIAVRTGLSLQDSLSILDIPSRSRLYGLLPCRVGTIWTESLTSYINRLGWVHRVSPLGLVVQELVPRVSREHLPARFTSFCRSAAMGLNGNSDLAHEWSTCLEQLTGRSELSQLTLQKWIGNLFSRGHLQKTPTWCSACYAEWREKRLPIYQPLLWQYQAITLCPEHQQRLERRCPQCSRSQSAISANRFEPGLCTQCGAWLGSKRGTRTERGSDDEIAWQQWVIRALEELHVASLFTGTLQWELFFTGLATCLQEHGAYSRLEHLTGMRRSVFYRWLGRPYAPHPAAFSHHYTPTLEAILEFCYACDVTPFQIMTQQLGPLRDLIQGGTMSRSTRPRRPAPTPINRQKCLEFIQTILDGKEEPLSIRQIAKRLGYGERTIVHHFPQECASITKRVQEYRKQHQEQRLDLARNLVRQTVVTLHEQGIYPSHRKVREILPTGLMRMPEANAIWHEVLHELGLDIH
jgi:hypothetical protein